jgi:glycosyltransferase involved in cell wall biosynthesis
MWGGGQAQSLGLALGLAERGEKVHFLAQPGGALAERLATTGLSWEAFPLRGLAGALRSAQLRARFRRLDPDIVHLHDSAAQIPAMWAAGRLGGGKLRRGRPRVVVTRRTDLPVIRPRRACSYEFLCDRVICVSEAARQRLLTAGVPAGRLCVIPDFVDCRLFDPAAVTAERDERPTVVSVGRLTSEKGHVVLLRAMARVMAHVPGARLVMCGEGDQKDALQKESEVLGIARAVAFMGFLSDVRPVLAAADVFVMPSLSEGLGVAALEAMAMARPVLASAVGGLRESVVDGETGLLVPPGEPLALEAGITALLEKPELARALGRAGRERVLAQFDRGPIIDRVLAVYRDVLAEG